MLKKSLLIILCALLMLSTFTACGEIKGSDAGIVFPIDKDPEYLDPQIITFEGSKNIIANCFEGLVTLDKDGNIIPGTAESWEISPDGMTYTFRLRQDAKWRVSIYAGPLIGLSSKETNSLPVTAHDFVFGLTRAIIPETKSHVATALYSIKNAEKVNKGKMSKKHLGIRALDDYTLEISLERPDPDFLFTLLEPGCMPCNEKFFEATGGRYGLAVKYLIYNGPFYINNWVDDVSVSIRKNDYYYDAENVLPRSVYFSINDEQDTRLDKLKEKTYSASPLTAKQSAEIADSKKYTVTSFDSGVLCFAFNCADSVTSNKSIRRALASSIDQDVLAADLGAPDAKGLIPDALAMGDKRYRDSAGAVYPYKSGKSQELFEAGLKALKLSSCKIGVICSEEYETTVRKLMQSWQSALGIKLEIYVETLSPSQLSQRVQQGNYQVAFIPVSFTDNTAFHTLQMFTSTGSDNFLSFKDKSYDKLVSSIKYAGNLPDMTKTALQAEKALLDSAAIVPLYTSRVYYGLAKGVSGTYFNLTGDIAYFKYTLSE